MWTQNPVYCLGGCVEVADNDEIECAEDDDVVRCLRNEQPCPMEEVDRALHTQHAQESDFFRLRRGALVRGLRRRLDVSRDEDDVERLDRLLAGIRALAPLVLRNLTMKQYVRDSVLAEAGYNCCLGLAICVQALWSDEGSGIWGLDDQAAWAGHRFDITAMKVVEDEEGWADVSLAALEFVEAGCMR